MMNLTIEQKLNIIRKEFFGLKEAGSLPVTVKSVNSPKLKKAKDDPNSKRAKEFSDHHRTHSGPHITGQGAEHATYDFDDDDYDVEGGLQKRKDTQKRGYEPVEEYNKMRRRDRKQMVEASMVSNAGVPAGESGGDAWPDGIFTRYGSRRIMTAPGMPRGMIQVRAPASDSPYGGDGSKRHIPDLGGGEFERSKLTPKNLKDITVIDPHKDIRSDEPPMSPKMRVFGRRAFGYSPDYIIPKESANFAYTTKNALLQPTTPPEGTVRGDIPLTPEPGAKEAGGRGYRQLQKGGESVINGLDPLYILKMMGKYSAKKEGLKEQIDFRKTLKRLKVK